MRHGIRIALLTLIGGMAAGAAPEVAWRTIAWNNLGMHCMDAEYSVFSILPPFNTLQAQVVDPSGGLITDPAGLTVTYEAVADPSGSFNTTSIGKTDFWQHVLALYGVALPDDVGLAGTAMPGTPERAAAHDVRRGPPRLRGRGHPDHALRRRGREEPLPDDASRRPRRRRSASGEHERRPSGVGRDGLPHVPRLGDRGGRTAAPRAGSTTAIRIATTSSTSCACTTIGRRAILPTPTRSRWPATTRPACIATATIGGTSVLCARCHASNALPGTGQTGITTMTEAMHAGHAGVTDPVTGQTLDAATNRAACYRCHPGSETRCLRGPMGNAVAADGSLAIQCQECHGSMSRGRRDRPAGLAGRAHLPELPHRHGDEQQRPDPIHHVPSTRTESRASP